MAQPNQPNFWQNMGLALSQGAMAMGEGMTGQPFLSNYQKMQMQRQQMQSELRQQQADQAYRQQQLQLEQAKFKAERTYRMWNAKQTPQVVPIGFEVIGYDQKRQPMIRKQKRDVSAEKFDLEQIEKKKQGDFKSDYVKESAQDILGTIAEVEKGINYFGLTGQLPSIPGTERTNWEVNINKLLSGKVIDVMTKMKEASKTGATGFGQLSNKELSVLKEASTALKKGLPPKHAQRYLNQMKTSLQKVLQPEQGDIQAKIKKAKDSGYTDEEISAFLGKK